MSKVNLIEDILRRIGPSPSAAVRAELVKAGVSEGAARIRVFRAKGDVRKSNKVNLPKQEKFIYLREQYNSQDYWDAQLKAHLKANSAYGLAVQSLICRGGWVPSEYFDILSGSPDKLSKHIPSSAIKSNLIDDKWITEEIDPRLGACIKLNPHLDPRMRKNYRYGDVIVDDILTDAVYDWAKKTGLVSFNAVEKRDPSYCPKFGHFKWDITGPCYLSPFVTYEKNKPVGGFVAIDVTNNYIDAESVKYFLRKCATNKATKKMKRHMSIFVAQEFSKEAFALGKSNGLMFTTPQILFGKDVALALIELTGRLNNAAAIAAKDPEKFYDIFNRLTAIEGAAGNLRGTLLEILTGHVVSVVQGDFIELGVIAQSKGGDLADIDVLRTKGRHEVAFYECKGVFASKLLDLDDVKHWLNNRVPVIRDWASGQRFYRQRNMIFELWTTGGFTDEAKRYLRRNKIERKKYTIDWKDGNDIQRYCSDHNLNMERRMLEQHFFKKALKD